MTAFFNFNYTEHLFTLGLEHSCDQGLSPVPPLLLCEPSLSCQARKADHRRLDSMVNVLEWRFTKSLNKANGLRARNFRCD